MLVFFIVARMSFSSQRNHYLIFLGTFLLLMKSGTSQSDSVSQTQNNMEIQEGEDGILLCNFTTLNSNPYLFWYRQHGNQRPERILTAYKARSKNNHFREGKFSTTLIFGKQNSASLNIGSVSLLDGAVYFCARNSYNKIIFGSGTRLIVIPNLSDSEPSVYQLKSKNEQSNVAACLITDYSPNPIDVKTNRNSNSNSATGSTVVVKDGNNKESASLGVVIWGKNDDQFHCSATYKGTPYEAENQGDDTCSKNTLSSTPAFETDERLNLLSLTVLGLRMIFFKSVALNLILTYWAWSR